MKTTNFIAGFILAAVSGVASASSVGTLAIPFTPGDGNSNTNFVIDTNGDIEVGIKAKERFVGDLPVSGTTYSAPAGSPDNDGLASWNIDFSFDLGSNTLSNYQLEIGLDFDPTSGEDFTLLVIPGATPGLLPITQGSQNPGFGFWSDPGADFVASVSPLAAGFNPSELGTYSFFARVRDISLDSVLASATGAVVVTPIPAAAWLFLSAIGAAFGMKRLKRPEPESVPSLT